MRTKEVVYRINPDLTPGEIDAYLNYLDRKSAEAFVGLGLKFNKDAKPVVPPEINQEIIKK